MNADFPLFVGTSCLLLCLRPCFGVRMSGTYCYYIIVVFVVQNVSIVLFCYFQFSIKFIFVFSLGH